RHIRPTTQERVPADFFSAFHRFQQERVELVRGDAQERGDRRAQVGGHWFGHRDQRGVARQGRKLLIGGQNHRVFILPDKPLPDTSPPRGCLEGHCLLSRRNLHLFLPPIVAT